MLSGIVAVCPTPGIVMGLEISPLIVSTLSISSLQLRALIASLEFGLPPLPSGFFASRLRVKLAGNCPELNAEVIFTISSGFIFEKPETPDRLIPATLIPETLPSFHCNLSAFVTASFIDEQEDKANANKTSSISFFTVI